MRGGVEVPPEKVAGIHSPAEPCRMSRRQAEARAVVEQTYAIAGPSTMGIEVVEVTTASTLPKPVLLPPRRTLPPRKRTSTRGSSPSPRVPLTPVTIISVSNSRSALPSPTEDRQQTPTSCSSRKSTPARGGVPCSKALANISAGEPAHALRSVRSVDAMTTIPFPPETSGNDDEMDGSGVVLDADDLRDERLMATFAALDVGGNRAMFVHEIGDACVEQGWIRQSPALSSAAVINNAIRAYLRRCQTAVPPRACLLSKRQLGGSMIEAQLAAALHGQEPFADGKRPKGSVWFLLGRYAGREWSNPFDDLPAEVEMDAGKKRVEKRKPDGAKKGKGKGKDVEEEGKESRKSGRPRKPARSREGTSTMSVDQQVQPSAPLKIRFTVKRPVPLIVESEEDDRDPIDAFHSDRNREDIKPQIIKEENNLDFDMDSMKPVVQRPLAARQSNETDDTDSNWSMSESSDDEEEDDVVGQMEELAFKIKQEEVPMQFGIPPATPPHIQDSHLFPCNPLDPVNLSEPRQSHYALDDSSSDEENDHMRSSLFGRFRAAGFEDSAHEHDHDSRFDNNSDIDTPATTPRHYPEWDKDDMAPLADQSDSMKEQMDLQNAVQVLGNLLPDFTQARLSCSPLEASRLEGALSNDNSESTSPPPPPTTPVKEDRSSCSDLQTNEHQLALKASAGSRNVFNLHIPLPRMSASSPLASPSGHLPIRSKQVSSLEDKIAAYNQSPTHVDTVLPETHLGPDLPPLAGMDRGIDNMDLDVMDPNICVCEGEEEEMIWETEGMTLGDSPLSDDPAQTLVGSPSDGGYPEEPALVNSNPGSIIDIVNWSRTNHLAEGVDEEYRWKTPFMKTRSSGPVSGLDLQRESSPLTELESEDAVSMSSPTDLPDVIGSSPLAPLMQLRELMEQDWSSLLGPESVGIDELDTVWGLFSGALEEDAGCVRSRRGNSEETIHSNKRSDKARTSRRRGRSHTIGEWGHIGVGQVCSELKKQNARFARALLAKAAVAVSGRSQSRESRRSVKAKYTASESTDTEDGVGIQDLEEAAKDLAVVNEEQNEVVSPSTLSAGPGAEDNQEDLLAFASMQYSDDYYPSFGITPWLLSARSDAVTPRHSTEAVTPTTAATASSQAMPATPAPQPAVTTCNTQASQSQEMIKPVPVLPNVTKATASVPVSASLPTSKLPTIAPALTASSAKPVTKTASASSSMPSSVNPSAAFNSAPASASVDHPGTRVLIVYPQRHIFPACRAQVVDRIPVFHCVWNNTTLLRRIDSDYINVSAVLKAIDFSRRQEVENSLAAQPSNARVVSPHDIGTAGVWVPLHIGREVAKSCGAPKPLLDIFLHDNLPDYFPSPLPNVKAAFKIGSNGRSSNCFGLPFGSILTSKAYTSVSGQPGTRPGATQGSANGVLPRNVAPRVLPTLATANPPSHKRPSPPVPASEAGKPAKRRKSITTTTDAVAITSASKPPPRKAATATTAVVATASTA